MGVTRRTRLRQRRAASQTELRSRFMQLADALPSDSLERAMVLATAARSTGPGEEMLACAILVSAADALLTSVPQSYAEVYRAVFLEARAEYRMKASYAATLLEKAQTILGRVDSDRAFELKVHAFWLQECSFILLGEINRARVVLCAANDTLHRRAVLLSSDDCGLPENSLVRESMRYFKFRTVLLEFLPKLLARDFYLAGSAAEPLFSACIDKIDPTLASKLISQFDFGDGTSSTAAAAVIISIQQIRLSLSCAQSEEGTRTWESVSAALSCEAENLLGANQHAVALKILRTSNTLFRALSLLRGGDTQVLRSMTTTLMKVLEDLESLPEDFNEHDREWRCPSRDLLKSLTLLVLSGASFNLEQGKVSIRFARDSLKCLKIANNEFLNSTSGCDDCRVALSFSARIQLARSCMAGGQAEASRAALSGLTAFSTSASANLTEPAQLSIRLLSIQLSLREEESSIDFDEFASMVYAAGGMDDLKALVAIHELLFRNKSSLGAQNRRAHTANKTIIAAFEFSQGHLNIDSDVVLAKELFHAALSKTGNEQLIGNVLLGLSEIFRQHSTITPEAFNLANTAKTLAACAGDACLDLRACRQISKMLYRTPDSPERKKLLKAAAFDEKKAESTYSTLWAV